MAYTFVNRTDTNHTSDSDSDILYLKIIIQYKSSYQAVIGPIHRFLTLSNQWKQCIYIHIIYKFIYNYKTCSSSELIFHYIAKYNVYNLQLPESCLYSAICISQPVGSDYSGAVKFSEQAMLWYGRCIDKVEVRGPSVNGTLDILARSMFLYS